jgi:mono/diheme cytochrome c family protein
MRYRTLAPLFVLAVLSWGASREGDAGKGKALFIQQCVTCHNAASNEKKLGPGLKGLFKLSRLANGKKASEENIRAQIDNGGNGMPPYKDLLSDQEKDDLIAYLKTL